MTAELLDAAQTLPAVQTVSMANSAEREAAEKQEVAQLGKKQKAKPKKRRASGPMSNHYRKLLLLSEVCFLLVEED